MTGPSPHLIFRTTRSGAERGGLWAPLATALGAVAALVALVVGAVLAVFTALAVAVIALVGGLVVALTGLWMRSRKPGARVRPTDAGEEVIEARRVGHQWVAYGWDRASR